MQRLPRTPELKALARRMIWFEKPEQALADWIRLAAYTLTFGTPSDVRALRAHLSDDHLREALDRAPPGVFDPRSWAYWHLKLNGKPAPAMPVRRLGRRPLHPA
jgi:hypothetical protein